MRPAICCYCSCARFYQYFVQSPFFSRFQAAFYSTALKTLISVSTVILLGLIVAYHALEVQVIISIAKMAKQIYPL